MQKEDLISLVIANLLVIFAAFIQHLDLSQVLWIYWMQSIIIGFFHCIKILLADKLYIIKNKDKVLKFPLKGRIIASAFFVVHFGMFHLGYAFFLFAIGIPSKDILYVALFFVINQLFTFHKEEISDVKLMWRPYARVIPMHLVMFIAFILPFVALPFFLILKTTVDILSEKYMDKL